MTGAETDDGVHILPSVVADHLEHALEGGDHFAQHLDAARSLGGGSCGKLVDQAIQRQRHGGHDRVPVKRRRALETVRHDREGVEHARGDGLAGRQAPGSLLDGSHGVPGLHEEDAENELAVLVFEHPDPVLEQDPGHG